MKKLFVVLLIMLLIPVLAYGANPKAKRVRITDDGDLYTSTNVEDALQEVGGPAVSSTGWTDDGTDVRLTTSTNSVGIGTTLPVEKLSIYESSGDTAIRIRSNTDNAYLYLDSNDDGGGPEHSDIIFQDNRISKWSLGKSDDDNLLIYDAARGSTMFRAYANGNLALMESGGNVGIGTTTPLTIFDVGSDTSPIHVGSGAAVASSNPAIVIDRVVTNAASNAHAFVDESSYTLGAGYAFNSYNAIATTAGTENLDHIASFQMNNRHGSSGTLDKFYGLYSAPVNNGGNITNMYHTFFADCTGAGTVTNEYGLYIPALTKGSAINEAIHVHNNYSRFRLDGDGTETLPVYLQNGFANDNSAVGIPFILSNTTRGKISCEYNTTNDSSLRFYTHDGTLTENMTLNKDGDVTVVGDVTVGGELKGTRAYFHYGNNTTLTTSGYQKTINGVGMSAADGYRMLRDGSIIGHSTLTGLITTTDGDVTFEVRINNANQATLENEFAAALGVGVTSTSVTVARDTVTFSAGDIIQIYALETGTMSWDDVIGYVEVVFDD